MMDSTNILNLRLNFTRMFEDHSSPSYGCNPSELGTAANMAPTRRISRCP